ncbi:hypothetical protein TVAG_320040 [Trichomonas vaginalis G3]|uniref:Uncharacterized protein n=1 Tax=Trichomonas vaginalis (strain ATCC PRA-98 / G3) TaxID=412133 RepID=A2DQF2_TRIV3|nr:hypothetical protein TVAGG3_1009900 [Trichomonas vaginalis G3]EAY17409.1 hypothetical protein TVAG_320040 [Trichomonas vaginalis G3]KAI5491419.1 hypothetical protein TVAGG3_1009900 [Trichomonas vaginalis G3]|eukprot:XP_001330778.1 hypothetical protein [Trichomonas vaginalis G3]
MIEKRKYDKNLLRLELEDAFEEVNESQIEKIVEKSDYDLNNIIADLNKQIGQEFAASNIISSMLCADTTNELRIKPIPGKIKQNSIDFHGLRRKSTKQATLRIAQDISPNNNVNYSFIYGKGNNSKGNAILKYHGKEALNIAGYNAEIDAGRINIKSRSKIPEGNVIEYQHNKF